MNISNISTIFQVYHTAENRHLGKPNDKSRMDNPETLPTLGTQDTSLIMIDTYSFDRCKSNYHISYDLEIRDIINDGFSYSENVSMTKMIFVFNV